jgi:DNA replication licensing factor MCM4
MQLIYNCSAFVDKQLIKLQEAPDDIPEGETPHTVSMFTRQDLVDCTKPGDRVTVVGIYRAQPVRINPRSREVKSIFKTFIDVMHVEKDGAADSLFSLLADETQAATPAGVEGDENVPPGVSQPGTFGADGAGLLNASNMTAEQVEEKRAQFRELAATPDVYERLAASLAPSIWQLEDVKKGLLCQLFGGVSKNLPAGRTRGELNVLLVGDPGVSKSQILGYVHKIAPRGIYTSGKGSSAVGLTAYVTRDPETREMVLESGALVLSDRGVCCIDEFDKMSDAARSTLHEVMEQQTISVAKAGIIATLNARTSVLAAANPVGSRYNPQLSIVDNLSLPPSLMSRFDLIYLLLDKADEANDRRLARHLIALYGDVETLGDAAAAPVPADLLREYVSFARATCQPKLTPESAQKLANAYADMRALGMSRRTVSATPRQLESLIRLSESLARMRLGEWVEESDVEEAVRLMRVALQQSSVDPRTGQIDMDVIQTGVSAADRTARAQLASKLRDLLEGRAGGNNNQQGTRIADLVEELGAAAGVGVTERDVQAALAELQGEVKVTAGRVTLAHS